MGRQKGVCKQKGGKQKGGRRRRRRQQRVVQSGGNLKGTVGPSIPDYGTVTNNFHIKYSKPGPIVPRISSVAPLRLQTARQFNYTPTGSNGALDVVIKGRPIAVFPKGKNLARTTV